MTSPTHFIGIDLADETFAVSVLPNLSDLKNFT